MKEINDLILLGSSIKGLSISRTISDFDAGISLVSCWQKVSSMDANSFSSIDCNSTESQLIEWCVRLINTADLGNSFLISIGGYKKNSWITLAPNTNVSAIAAFWLASDSREMLVCDVVRKRLLGITSEEYTYEAYSFQIDDAMYPYENGLG